MRLLRPPTILVVLAVSAGCLATTPVDTTDPLAPDAAALAAARLLEAPAALAGPGGDAEVSLAVSPSGEEVLACSHGGFEQPSPLYASTNGGASFARVRPAPNQDFNGDCDVSIGTDESWFIIYDTVASATVARSLDKGQTWRLTYVDAVPFGVVDRPWIHAIDQDRVYLVYGDLEAATPAVDTFAFSTDGGLTFVHRVFAVAEPPNKTQNLVGKPLVYDEGRTVRIPMYRWDGQGGPVALDFAVSRDAGLTWTFQTAANPGAIPLQLATGGRGPDGTLYFSYTNPNREDVGDVMLVYSTDDGNTWSQPLLVAENQTFSGLPTAWVDGGPEGSATLGWMTSREEGDETIWQAAVARVKVAETPEVVFAGPVGPLGERTALYEFYMVRHDAAGRAFAAYPLVTGPDCLSAGSFPSTSGDVERSNQCVYVVVERAAETVQNL